MRRVTADEAVQVIRSGDTILIGGSGGGHAVPEALMAAVERRFLAEGEPRNITRVASGRPRRQQDARRAAFRA